MESEPEILLAEIPCTSCAYNLHMLPVTGRCPECGAAIAHSLREALMAQKRNGWEVAALVRAAGWLNVLLLIGAAAGGVAFFVPPMRSGLCFVLPAWAIYAIFQTVAVLEAKTWPAKSVPRHRIIALSGMCFAALPLLTIVAGIVSVAIGSGALGSFIILAVWTVLFPAIGIFTWAAGEQYAALCVTSEMDALRAWCRRMGWFNAAAVAVLEVGLVWRLATEYVHYLSLNGPLMFAITDFHRLVSAILVTGGVALLLAGTAATAVLQFVLARRLRHLAKKAGSINLTGPALPTPPSPTS